ncbi:MAG: hypothetical protein ACPGVG_17790, partial [Mycobacterium sp.]
MDFNTHNTPLQTEVVKHAAPCPPQVIEMIEELFSPHAASPFFVFAYGRLCASWLCWRQFSLP